MTSFGIEGTTYTAVITSNGHNTSMQVLPRKMGDVFLPTIHRRAAPHRVSLKSRI